jgi:hypothetical protein
MPEDDQEQQALFAEQRRYMNQAFFNWLAPQVCKQCFFLSEILHCGDNVSKISPVKCTECSFGKNEQNLPYLRKESQKSSYWENEFVEVAKTKQDSKIFLLCCLTYSQIWLIPLDDHHSIYLIKMGKKEKKHPLFVNNDLRGVHVSIVNVCVIHV